MKLYFTSFSQDGSMDGCVRHQVANQFEHAEPQDCDYVGLVITYTDSWKFNRDEYESLKHKPFVIFDYTEYGWEHTSVNHFYGYNTNEFSFKFNNTEYLALDEAIKNANVKCYFKRELPKGASSPFNTFPAEYPCILPQEDPVSFESYNARAIAIFFNWGWSNPSRPNLHGALYSMAHELGYTIVSHRDLLAGMQSDHPGAFLVLSQFIPHYARMGMDEILHLQRSSKISVSLNGCGVKCFRNAESPINSVMAIQENSLEWTSEWNETNSIILPNKENGMIDERESIKKMISILKQPEELYQKYLAGVENNRIYQAANYANELRTRIASN